MESLAKLFGSSARLKLLRLFLFNRERSFDLAETALRAKLAPHDARRELAALCAAGLLRRRGAGSACRYQTNPKFAHLAALEVFIRETTALSPERMIAALRGTGSLRLVALSGFFTGVAESSIDLLIAGDRLNERVLARTLREFEAELGREIRYAAFSTEDFRYRLGVYDRLIRDVLDYPHRLLVDRIGL